MDERIWKLFLNAGIWYGWSCFPKDIKSLINQFKENNLTWEIITKVDETNTSQVQYFLDKIFTHYNNNIHWKTIWVLWVAFKPGTDDLRDSKWIEVIKKLMYSWAKLKIYDYSKEALLNFKKYLDWIILWNSRWFFEVEIVNNFDELVNKTDSLVITIEDKKILWENLANIKLKDNIIFDWKNILDRKVIEKLWCKYIGVWY
jgi:UDPglucose 6-dehydrogenase